MRLLLVNPFPPNSNPNPHLPKYVESAASRALGAANVLTVSMSDSIKHLEACDAVLVLGSLAYAIREIRSVRRVCKNNGVPLLFWSTDDPYEIDLHLQSSDCFDWIWTNDKASLPFYDLGNISHLPLGADPQVHCQEFPTDERHYEYDVSFVGAEFPNRREIFRQLQPFLEALDTAVIGPNWTLRAKFIQRRRITNMEAARLANRSRVVLNIGRSFDLANTRGIVPSTPGPRTFEVGGSSTVQVVTWDQPEVEEYYSLGKEIILCDGFDMLEAEIQDLLVNRDRRKSIAESSLSRTKKDHLYDSRFKEIFNRMIKLR